MSSYVYRVTKELVELNDGRKAHVAEFAYKPCWSGFDAEQINRRMAFQSGCVASERLKLKSDLIITLSKDRNQATIYKNVNGAKTFYDDSTFGTERMPLVAQASRGSVQGFYVIDSTTLAAA